MAWIYLLIAAAFEVTFATSMKLADGFTRLWPSVVTVVAVIGGIGFLTLALKELPLSVGYPAWVAIGSLGTVLFGVLWFGETLTPLKLMSVALIVAGVIGLRVATSA
jgi:quaternary ammonium compound-resistance protein SugE